MTSTQSGALMRRARKLLRSGDLTHHQFSLLDCLVFACRQPGSDRACVSYTRLARLAGMARDTVRRGLARLERLGLLDKLKRRVRVRWGLGAASRQATSTYIFRLCTEADRRPVYQALVNPISCAGGARRSGDAMERALSRLGAALRSAGAPGA